MSFNLEAVVILGRILLIVLGLTGALHHRAAGAHRPPGDAAGHVPLFLFFGSIGLGFVLVEISQMQRLIIFLGHPTYGAVGHPVRAAPLERHRQLLERAADQAGRGRLGGGPVQALGILIGVLNIGGSGHPVLDGGAGELADCGEDRGADRGDVARKVGWFLGLAFPLGIRQATGARFRS